MSHERPKWMDDKVELSRVIEKFSEDFVDKLDRLRSRHYRFSPRSGRTEAQHVKLGDQSYDTGYNSLE